VQLLVGGGGASGIIGKGDKRYVLQGYSAGFFPGFSFRSAKRYSLDLGGALHQMNVKFKEDGVLKTMNYGRFGGYIGFGIPLSEIFTFQFQGEVSQRSHISVLSVNDILLNGETFTYSTLQTYKGSQSSLLRINIMHDKIDGGFSKAGRYRTGVGFSIGHQRLIQEENKIRTSSTARSPEETLVEKDVDFSLRTGTIDFFIGLAL
jgi:hypothetical protein